MVKVIDYKTRSNELGEDFNVLIVQGGVEPIKSKTTGKLYFSARKASVPCTFDESICEELVGTAFEGKIIKVPCEPYQYTIEDTGETIERTHRYEFINEELELVEEHMISEQEVI
jgi:hypothetical protein